MLKSKKGKVTIAVAIGVVVIAAIVIVICNLNSGHRVIKLNAAEGPVSLIRKEQEIEIVGGMNLKSKDTLETGSEGLVHLLADTDKYIVVLENTCIAIEASGNEEKGLLKVELMYGTTLIDIDNKLEEGSAVELHSPNATLSVRGTTFETTYTEADNTTVVKVTDGVVNVASATDEEDVPAGYMATVKDDTIEIDELIPENAETDTAQGTEGSQEEETTQEAVGTPTVITASTSFAPYGIAYIESGVYTDIKFKDLEGWTPDIDEEEESREATGFVLNGLRISHKSYIEERVNSEIEEGGESGELQSLDYLKNDDGDTIICTILKRTNEEGEEVTSYQYYKPLENGRYIRIRVIEEDGSKALSGTDLSTFLLLSNDEFFEIEYR